MNTTKIKYSCVILAGGEGKRVDGRDKGLIDYKNKPLIQHVIDAITPQTQEIIISANRNVKRYDEFGYKVIADSNNDSQGPLSGIAATLPYCNNEHVLIVPCDMPHLPTNLIERLSSSSSNKNISVVKIENKLQIVLLLHKKLLPAIQQSLEDNERRLIRWIKSQHPEVVTFHDTEAFTNYNFTADFN